MGYCVLLKILQICPKYYSSIGGVENAVKELAIGMKNRGHDISVLCGGSSSNGVETFEIDGIKIISIPTFAPGGAFHIPKNAKIIKGLIGNDIDIVHTHSAHAVISRSPMQIKKNSAAKWKLVYSMHFSTPGYSLSRRMLWRFLWKEKINTDLNFVDNIHTTSNLETKLVNKNFSNSGGKISQIPLGIPQDVFSYRWKGKNSDYFLYCGRIEKYKQIDLALKSIEALRKEGSSLKFFVIGNGSRSRYFEKMAKVHDWITYLPFREREEYLGLLSNARGVISMSSTENFNLFLAEACAIGVPIVATPGALAFCPEFANVEKNQIELVKHAVVKSLSEPESCIFPKKLAQSWETVIDQFERFYEEVVA